MMIPLRSLLPFAKGTVLEDITSKVASLAHNPRPQHIDCQKAMIAKETHPHVFPGDSFGR